MEDQKIIKPIKILAKNIPTVDVARYYLEIEFFKLFKNRTQEMSDTIIKTMKELSDSKIWELLEAISFTYHLNGVFYNIGRENYTWNMETWHVKDLILTGMDSKANKVIFSERINGDAIKFKKYLLHYFDKAGEEDPEGLLSYKPSKKPIPFDKLLMKEQNGKIHMLDGSHRLVEMLLADKNEVTAFVGHPDTEEAENRPKNKIGKSIFILLTILFKKGNEEERSAVLTVLKQLINNSTDGHANAVQYWIERQLDKEIKEAGIDILQ